MIKIENQAEALELCELLNKLKYSERREFLMFLKGIKYAQNITNTYNLK